MIRQVEYRSVKLLIIGAGTVGLCAAKTYLELEPETDLIILDDKSNVGGVWAEKCCYKGLKTQNMVGSYEFSDFPMDSKYGLSAGQHISGITMHKYLTDYANHHDIMRRIIFQARVVEIEKLDNGAWKVLTQETGRDGTIKEVLYDCKKIVAGTGLSSVPNPVSIPGMENFDRLILSASQLTEKAPALLKDPAVGTVTVLGGSKTAYDSVFTLASAGKKVEWVIRKSGIGPLWMTPEYIHLGLFKVKPETLVSRRIMTWLSPCVWGDADGYGFVRRLFNKTRLGRYLMHTFWEKLRKAIVDVNGYRKHPALAGLEPDEGFFWTGRVGILNYETDIHDLLKSGQVTLRRNDVSHLSEAGTVNFVDGTTLRTDAVIAITGWTQTSTIKYTPENLEARLGIPTTKLTDREAAFWDDLDAKADVQILKQLPYLQIHAPKRKMPIKSAVTPFRLYRAAAPPGLTATGDRSIVFLKMLGTTANMALTELQVLWSFAYLENKLNIDQKDVYWQSALMSRFGRHRTPCGFGAWYPEMNYDSVAYCDLLLKDLGLSGRRKPTLLKEIFEGYLIHDYKGVVQEWKKRQLERLD